MNLGQIIDALESLPPEWAIRRSDGGFPGEFGSWRGVYAELTIYPTAQPTTVGDLLKAASGAVGATFQGYKGGEFVMDRDTRVWADEWGACSYNAITAIATTGSEAQLIVTNVADYRW